MNAWSTFTHFGNSTVMLSVAVIITIWLMTGSAWRMAFWWCVLFGAGLLIVLATKIAFVGWGIGIRDLDFTGISGHAMRATAVMPVMLYLMLQNTRRPLLVAGVLLGLLFGVLIGISRLVVNVHSISEVVAGCLLGGIISIVFLLIAAPLPKPAIRWWYIGLSLIVMLGASRAEPVPSQRWVRDVSLYLAGHDRPYIRATWKMAPVLRKAPIDADV
ncbi:membrane-associated phospholipid phosphatase [Glaciimonas sp. PCH181]|nr:membrane-associated phospholipid phosphatase [Glaciimonas sp. PCH181]